MKAPPDRLVGELLRAARADRWGVTAEAFGEAVARSARHGAGDGSPRDVERYLRGLHLEDLALACACAAGSEEAWDHFVGWSRCPATSPPRRPPRSRIRIGSGCCRSPRTARRS